MAILVMFETEGATASKYDEVLRQQEARGESGPEGRMYHVAYGDKQNLQVIAVFESQEKLEAHGAKLMPILEKLGIKANPRVFEVYNIIEG
jgi:hypothetical protein